MTPQQFSAAYLPTAQKVSAGTGIDPNVLLAQWAIETGWGTSFAGQYNLGNIRSAAGPFLNFASLADFAFVAIQTWHNGYYGNVLASAGQSAAAQIAAIGASPWDSGHYGNPPGSHLWPYFNALPGFKQGVTPDLYFLHDTDNNDIYVVYEDPIVFRTVKRHITLAEWTLYNAAGATAHDITSGPLQGVPDGSPDSPATAPPAPQPAPAVDLSPVLNALAAITAKVIAIEAKVDKDLA